MVQVERFGPGFFAWAKGRTLFFMKKASCFCITDDSNGADYVTFHFVWYTKVHGVLRTGGRDRGKESNSYFTCIVIVFLLHDKEGERS